MQSDKSGGFKNNLRFYRYITISHLQASSHDPRQDITLTGPERNGFSSHSSTLLQSERRTQKNWSVDKADCRQDIALSLTQGWELSPRTSIWFFPTTSSVIQSRKCYYNVQRYPSIYTGNICEIFGIPPSSNHIGVLIPIGGSIPRSPP